MNSILKILDDKNILVVDDDVLNRASIVDSLYALSPLTKVLSAPDGEKALKIIAQKNIDLVLLDWEMPVMDGITTLKQLKANPETAAIPVVMYTGIMTDISSLKEALNAGAADFLRKPTDPIEILARIRSILTQRQLQKAKEEAQLQEILGISLQLQHNETLLESIKKQMQLALKDKDPSEQIQQIIKNIIFNDLTEPDWNRYKSRLDIGQQGFIEKLSAKHPELSRQQLTICSLLHKGLVSKEAAKILNMSSDAIDKSRHRIRKKMQLSADISLENYLLQI
jgi:DNA-binding response OmpR family regulator